MARNSSRARYTDAVEPDDEEQPNHDGLADLSAEVAEYALELVEAPLPVKLGKKLVDQLLARTTSQTGRG